MSIDENDESNSEIYPSDSIAMSKKQASICYISAHHYKLTRRYFWIFALSCLISTTVFTITFYFNISHVYALYSNVYLPTTHEVSIEQALKAAGIVPAKPSVKPSKVSSIHDENITYNDFNYFNSDTLTYENRTYSNNVQILFRLPKKRDIISLLLIFHGCGRSAQEWFDTIERQRIIGTAIDLGYGCLVFQATDHVRRCWSSDIDIDNNIDAQMVFKGLEKFYEEHPKLESLPRFTFGASSGGIFSSIFVLNQRYKIQGQILFISIIHPEILERHIKANSYPPTAWIYMLRDIEFASEDRINASMQIFAQQKIAHTGLEIEPIRLTSTTFHERIPSIPIAASYYIFYRLQQNKWLDTQNYLIYNPRRDERWKTFLFNKENNPAETRVLLRIVKQHENILLDFLNTIYGEHEISFERSFEALTWHQCIYNKEDSCTT